MIPPFALPPFDFPLPAYVRQVESGLLMPRKAVLPGLVMPPGLVIPRITGPNYVFCGYAENLVDQSSYTFSNVYIGPAAADRLVVVTTGSNRLSNGLPTSVTIGGSAATLAEGASGANAVGHSAIWYRSVSTGTTATIVVNHSNRRQRCAIGVYALYGLSSTTPVSTNSSNTNNYNNSRSVTVAVQPGDIIIARAGGGVTLPTSTWTGVNKDFDELPENDYLATGGSAISATTNAVYSVLVTWSANLNSGSNIAVAVWR